MRGLAEPDYRFRGRQYRDRPYFLLGLPRSGTTLVERIAVRTGLCRRDEHACGRAMARRDALGSRRTDKSRALPQTRVAISSAAPMQTYCHVASTGDGQSQRCVASRPERALPWARNMPASINPWPTTSASKVHRTFDVDSVGQWRRCADEPRPLCDRIRTLDIVAD